MRMAGFRAWRDEIMKNRMDRNESDGLERGSAEGAALTVCLVGATLALFGAVALSALM